MERDIRDLFEENKEALDNLPKSHRTEFLEKLQQSEVKKAKPKFGNALKIIASVILILCVSYFLISKNDNLKLPNSFENQFSKIEKEYLNNIDKEWKQFTAITTDTLLIRKYKEKLKDFDTDYKNITSQLKEYPNNINVLESLITNLQRRLQLVKEIKEHIKELNQKNTSNETIYL